MFGYWRFTKRRLCLYLAISPFMVLYLIGLSYRSYTVEYIAKYNGKVFSQNESYLEENRFYMKLKNQSHETCAAIFRTTTSLQMMSPKADFENTFHVSMGEAMAIPWSLEQQENALLFTAEITTMLQGVDLQGNSGNFPDQQRFYFEVAQMKFIKTVCETGFNAGHSAFIWLNANSDAKLYSFDIGEHNYTKPAVQLLQSMFPGRLQVKYGDSRWTVPEFHRLHPEVECDLVVVDGGHYQNVPYKDLQNFRKMASQTNMIILDDQPGPEYFRESIDSMWKEMINRGEVKELFSCMSDITIATLDREKGLTLGKYI